MKNRFPYLAISLLALFFVLPFPAYAGIENTVHNLTATGPGEYKAPEVGHICIFCHITHNAKASRALWNRESPAVNYKLYESSTAEAVLNQPTGSSRLCLSCHDGTIALGDIRVKPEGVMYISLGPLEGGANLGTDLSDDHPISFVYDFSLVLKNPELEQPTALPRRLRLDETGQMQCTTCHDPHTEKLPKFLVMDNRFSGLCVSCHKRRYWGDSSHSLSGATWNGTGSNPWPNGFNTVAENACENCHNPHSAGHPERLLNFPREEENCLICHNGSVASKDLSMEFRKPSSHPVEVLQDVHDPREEPGIMPRHVECEDCHNPHAAGSGEAVPPAVSSKLRGVSGVGASGTTLPEAQFQYEICFKCHGLTEDPDPFLFRDDNVTNVRLELNPNNPSFHPVLDRGKNTQIVGLEAGYTAASIIYCTDCHNNEASQVVGAAPEGPHGSTYSPILQRQYDVKDGTPESFHSYALCYKCHTRSMLMLPASLFPHQLHVVRENSPCANCHDAHGSRNNANLINFKLREKTGEVVVSPSGSGRLEFVKHGRGSGSCFLTCHGKDHDPESYPF